MAILGIDYGAKKVGLAIAEGQVASPLRVIRAASPDATIGIPIQSRRDRQPPHFARAPRNRQAASWRRQLREEIRHTCEEYEVQSIVVGVPRPLRGGKSAQTREVEEFVEWLQREMTLPIIVEDERFTTAFAAKLTRGWKKKADDDAVAAALILQTYIERHAEHKLRD